MSRDFKIGCVWFLNANEAATININFTEAIWIILSDCGEYWQGRSNGDVVSTGDIPDVGHYTLGTNINHLAYDKWEDMRVELVKDNLGEPKFGIRALKQTNINNIAKSKSDCECEINMLMRYGCPSAKGFNCPQRSFV